MSLPRKLTVPPVAGVTPQIVLTSVVLPAPFGPINPSTSPRLIPSVTPRSACKPPKRRETASRRRISDCPSDMLGLSEQHAGTQRDQAVRQEQQQQHDQHAEHTGVDLDVVAPHHFLEAEVKERTADHAQRSADPSHQ